MGGGGGGGSKLNSFYHVAALTCNFIQFDVQLME